MGFSGQSESRRYELGPFALISDLPLPELPSDPTPGRPVTDQLMPVSITLGQVPQYVSAPVFSTPSCTASSHEVILRIPTVATFYVGKGNRVVIEPSPGCEESEIRAYLLANIFAILCHQQRLLPLHASAVRFGEGAVAFLGDSGAGKSTLAAMLVARGFPLVADDICLLDPEAEASQRVIPIAPWLKLWGNSLQAMGHDRKGLTRIFANEEKFRVPTHNFLPIQKTRLPLRGLIILKKETGNDHAPLLQSLSPVQSIAAAMRFTYQQYLLDSLGLNQEHFSRCGASISGTLAFDAHCAWGLEALPHLADRLQVQFEALARS
jgi:hypothetical protein